MKFEVGDKVRVLDGSNIEGYAGGWIPDLKEYVGKVSTIKQVCAGFTDKEGYTLDGFGNPGNYIFDGRGLERVTKQRPRRIIIEEKHGKVTARLGNARFTVEAESLEAGAEDALGKLLREPHEFKVGDVVEGTAVGKYRITKKGWIGRVAEIGEDGYIEVRGANLMGGYSNYKVEAKDFELKVPRD